MTGLMKMDRRWVGMGVAGILALLLPLAVGAADAEKGANKSRVLSQDKTTANKANWGEIRPYFTGESFATKDILVANGTVEPGKAVHGAHRHAEEEYLYITEGSGTWHLDGKEFPAKAGDVLYVEPWVYHGFTNTGDKPLRFFVVKYNAKGVKVPPHPDDNRPDELPK